MNRTTRSIFTALFAVALLGTAPVHAEESLVSRVATGVGHAIAAQGNAALAQIREEVKDKLADSIKPFLPADFKSEPKQDEAAPAV